MNMKSDSQLIYDPKPGATIEEVMELLRLFVFNSYPPSIRTKENLIELYNTLSPGAKRHFKLQN